MSEFAAWAALPAVERARPTVLLVGPGAQAMRTALAAVAPGARLLEAPSAAAGEPLLVEAHVAVIGDRLRPAYLTAPRLQWLHIVGAGLDGFSIPGLRDVPYFVTHKVEASLIPMAEHVLAQVLLFARQAMAYRALQTERRWVRHGEWPSNALIQVHGATLGIVGLGWAGAAVARRARAFGLRVIGTRRTTTAKVPGVSRLYPPAETAAMVAEADFVAILLPLTDATHRSFGERELRAMKRTAYLINISRGPVVDEAALCRALREQWIAGASLDVFEHEPLAADSELWSLPNVLITPHCGGVGPFLGRDAAAEVAADLRRFIRGLPPRSLARRNDVITTFDPPSH